MSGGAALAPTLERDGAVWRKHSSVPDHETIRGADQRSTSNPVCGIHQRVALHPAERADTAAAPCHGKRHPRSSSTPR